MAENTTPAFRHEIKIETWTLYGIGVFLTVTRFIYQVSRLRLKIRSDDWLVITALPWYTLLCIAINRIIEGGGSNYFPDPEEANHLTPEERHDREVGSKWVMTVNSRSDAKEYDDDCWAYFSFQVVVGVLNISSDIIVLCVAIPLILQLYLPIQQKIALTAVFGMGIFVIAASILNKVFSLAPKLMNYTYLSWYFREASVGLYVVNAPTLWVLLRRTFPSVSLWGYRSRSTKKETTSGFRLPSYGQPMTDDTERLRQPHEHRRWDIEDGMSTASPLNSVETVIHGGKA
ncbi:hypothetical protein KEM56_006338 [Ascosphaera pollenicola]|nr:hypothetical protein KEM56_006338 [Ascosphaera pollenicola]